MVSAEHLWSNKFVQTINSMTGADWDTVAISADPFFNGIHFYFTHFTHKYEVCYILATFEKVSQKNVLYFFFFHQSTDSECKRCCTSLFIDTSCGWKDQNNLSFKRGIRRLSATCSLQTYSPAYSPTVLSTSQTLTRNGKHFHTFLSPLFCLSVGGCWQDSAKKRPWTQTPLQMS